MTTLQQADTPRAIRGVRSRLRRIRRAARALLTTRVVSMLCVWGMLIVAAMVLADLVFRFPALIRVILLAVLLLAAVDSVRRRLLPVTRFKPSLSDIALRIEPLLDRRRPRETGPIASGIEVPIYDPDPVTRHLSRLTAADAAARFVRTPWGVLRWGPPFAALSASVLVALAVSAAFNAQPTLAVTGVTRLFAPWLDTPWPKRTQITDATPPEAHPADTGLPLRVALLKTNRPEGETGITVTYRVVGSEGPAGPETRAVLVPQPPMADGPSLSGELYERIVEPIAWQGARGEERWIEYSFATEDDTTARKRIKIVDPPTLTARTTTVDPPIYALGIDTPHLAGVETAPPPPGGDLVEIGPVLAGSAVRIELVYNKPVTPITDTEESTFGPDTAAVVAIDNSIVIDIRAEASGRLVLDATDRFGLRTRRAARLQLQVTPDAAPQPTVLMPEADESILPTATVVLLGEARDDIALTELRLEHVVARPDPTSLDPEPVLDPDREPIVAASVNPAPARHAEVHAVLELGSLRVEPGDEIQIRAVATDNYDLDGRRHGAVYSAPRRLRVIAPAEFIELIQAELEGVRRTAMRLDRQQADVIDQTRDAGEAEPEERPRALEQSAQRQTSLSQRLRAQGEMLERLRARADRNALEDETLGELLERAARATRSATAASERAAEQVARSIDEAEADPRPDQDTVRDELARLIDELDRGQDGWVVRRNIEQLLGEQRSLRDRTAQAGERMVGGSVNELTPDERTELERIARRQQELADRARDAIDRLSERADQIREQDPTQASAMDRAAEDAARDRLAEQLQQAAEQIGLNQTASAGSMQEQSIQAMENMLEQLENARRHRDAALRRQLASVIQSIESLIRQQQAVTRALDDDPADASRLARRLHSNTLATEAHTREGFPELARVGDLLARAAAAQAQTATVLLEIPEGIEPARAHSAESLARLNEALEEARKQDAQAEQRERERQRREMREAYREALAEQVRLREASAALAGVEPDRRQRAELRGLGQRQEALRRTIKAIPGEHETGEIGVVTLIHRRIDSSLAGAVRSLGRGFSDPGVLGDQDSAIALLRSILDTLTPSPREQDEFSNDQGAGGGGGGDGAGGAQPPIGNVEQLRLLRALQSIVLDQTRAVGDGGSAAGLAEVQREIAEQTRELIREMSPPRPDRRPAPETPVEQSR